MINSLVSPPIDFRQLGRHLSRPKSQRGSLSEKHPKRGKLPRGTFFGRWRVYFHGPDGRECQKKADKIIHRDLAEMMGIELAYTGPLTKTDAWRVLEKLIRETNEAAKASIAPGTPRPPRTRFTADSTFADFAQQYIRLNKPNWGENTARASTNLIEVHLAGKLGHWTLGNFEDADDELQQFLNGYVESGASASQLSKLKYYLRSILDRAVDQKIISRNPARKLKAKSRRKSCELSHTADECGALFAVASGRDAVAIRILAQLGLRPEELCALRRDDVRGNELVIDEAIVNGHTKEPKTVASAASVYVPADLAMVLEHYLETVDADARAWLFPATRKGVPIQPGNFLRRVLKPAAIRAGVAVTTDEKGDKTTALNFQSLRRTSSTLFGARAKDPKSTQAHMRHADPLVSLRHYQKAIPAEVKAAAQTLENDLIEARKRAEQRLLGEVTNARPS